MIKSKLPDIGTTIFAIMSAEAQKHQAINLSQGFPDFDVSPELIAGVEKAMRDGKNQYAPMPGLPILRERISDMILDARDTKVDPETEITITSGATEAIYCVIQALIHPGDEVILFDPAYDCYAPSIRLAGGVPVHIPLTYPDYRIPWGQVEEAITDLTAMIMVNNPHNPTGQVLDDNDWREINRWVNERGIYLLSDEVYEHITYGANHRSALVEVERRDRVICTYSFGKTFHVTGWKTGYAIAAQEVSTEIRKVHQYVTFSGFHPVQAAMAEYLSKPESYRGVSDLYRPKKELFYELMRETVFDLIPTYGSYYALANYSSYSDMPDTEMALWLTQEIGVAAIPISVFYKDKRDDKVLRFCFAKKDETLRNAVQKLREIKR
jgi:methionine aminotransferase